MLPIIGHLGGFQKATCQFYFGIHIIVFIKPDEHLDFIEQVLKVKAIKFYTFPTDI